MGSTDREAWWTVGATEVAPPPPVPRPPLPPFPSCGSCPSPFSYDQTLPWPPPAHRDYLRTNAWCVEVPGLPFVQGASSVYPTRFLSYLAYAYPVDWQIAGFTAIAERAYTHVVHSWPDARSVGGYSIDQFIDLLGRAKDLGLWNKVFWGSKNFDPQDQSADEWMARIGPALEACLNAGVVDECNPSWEHDLFNVPGEPTISFFKWVGQFAHAHGASCWAHFSIHVTSWFKDGDPRGRYGFWDDLGGDVDGIDYQGDVNWDIGELQSRLADTQKQFGQQGNVHRIRAYELKAAAQFEPPPPGHPNEDDGDLYGYLTACCHPVDGAYVWGYGNGGRRPDGTPL